MLSGGARLGDHSDDMSRSMMDSQLERQLEQYAGGPRRTGALAADQLGGLETRDRSGSEVVGDCRLDDAKG